MKRKPRTNGTAMSMPGGILLGSAYSTVIMVLLCALLAKLMELEKLTWEQAGYFILFSLLSASFLGAMIAANKIKHQRLISCLGAGCGFWGILMLCTALFFGGKYHAVGVTTLIILCGSLVAALLRKTERGGSITKKHYIRR
ncbi:MAG: hypothetical protein J6V25_09555 [Oscillospiraceae bacterium]|nr:hypothetical protein [Oscillospiraceae bacterium]